MAELDARHCRKLVYTCITSSCHMVSLVMIYLARLSSTSGKLNNKDPEELGSLGHYDHNAI